MAILAVATPVLAGRVVDAIVETGDLDTVLWLSGLKAASRTAPAWPRSNATRLPPPASQIRTVPSAEAVTTHLPRG